ncbi:hypothetical protein V6N13_047214 [Hibiscus sabdariffa]
MKDPRNQYSRKIALARPLVRIWKTWRYRACFHCNKEEQGWKAIWIRQSKGLGRCKHDYSRLFGSMISVSLRTNEGILKAIFFGPVKGVGVVFAEFSAVKVVLEVFGKW